MSLGTLSILFIAVPITMVGQEKTGGKDLLDE